MVLGDIERLKVVVRSFHLRPCDHRVAKREKNPLDLLERLAQRVPGADRPHHPRQGKIFALARKRRLVGCGFQGRALVRAHSFDMRLQRIKFLTDDTLQFRPGRLEPILGNFRQHAGFSAQPDCPKLLQVSRIVFLTAKSLLFVELLPYL